jgi:hypothetical protein
MLVPRVGAMDAGPWSYCLRGLRYPVVWPLGTLCEAMALTCMWSLAPNPGPVPRTLQAKEGVYDPNHDYSLAKEAELNWLAERGEVHVEGDRRMALKCHDLQTRPGQKGKHQEYEKYANEGYFCDMAQAAANSMVVIKL